MSYLKNISRLSAADNLGGVLTIQVARRADVQNIPDPVDGVVYGDIDFLPGKGFVTWEVTLETASADSAGRTSREGSSRSNKLPFVVPKDRADLRAMLEAASEDEFIVLFTSANGVQKLFGLPYAPVQFRFSATSGAKVSDLNHYSCEFFYDGPENMFEYDGTVSMAPEGPAPALVYSNGELIASLSPGQVLNIDTDFDFDFEIAGT